MTVLDRVTGAVFLLAGLGLLLAGIACVHSTRDYLRRTRVAPGLVLSEPFGPHHVVIRFSTPEGRAIRYNQNGMVTLHSGERIPVRYDPADPTMSPCVDQWWVIWEDVGFFGLMGSVFTAAGGFLLRSRGAAS